MQGTANQTKYLCERSQRVEVVFSRGVLFLQVSTEDAHVRLERSKNECSLCKYGETVLTMRICQTNPRVSPEFSLSFAALAPELLRGYHTNTTLKHKK